MAERTCSILLSVSFDDQVTSPEKIVEMMNSNWSETQGDPVDTPECGRLIFHESELLKVDDGTETE